MSIPVFVIHGTSNRSPDQLAGRVAQLQRQVGDRWTLHPVFWGDLGAAADHRWIRRTVPGFRDPTPPVVRGPMEQLPDDDLDSLAVALATVAAEPGGPVPDEADRMRMVAVGIQHALAERDFTEEAFEREIIEAVASAWTADLFWLWQVADPELLAEVGAAIATDVVNDIRAEVIEVRDREAIKRVVEDRLAVLNDVVGAALGAAGNRVNRWVRVSLAEQIAESFGDVIVYQRRQQEILDRVRGVIADVDPRLGRDPEHRVHLVGHSLGATIALDLATQAADGEPGPVWTDAAVTFGCLWPLFHVCDPRGGGIRPYTGHPVSLPGSIRRWTNLWEPLDPMAFVAANVFTLPDGTPPRDVEVKHRYSDGLSTHSAYWTSPQLASELTRAFAEPHGVP